MIIHTRGDVRVEGSPIEFPFVVLEKIWYVHFVVNPGPDCVIALDACHECIPLVLELVQVAAVEAVGVAHP